MTQEVTVLDRSQEDRAALDELAQRGLPLICGGSDEAPEPQADAPDEQVYGSDWFRSLPEPAQAELRRARNDAGKYRTEAKSLRSKVDEWGGEDTVREALNVRRQLDTEEGSWQVVSQAVSALRQIGFNDTDIAKQLKMSVGEVRDVPAGEDDTDDEPLTRKELQGMLENYFEQRQERSDEEQRLRMGHVVNNFLTMREVSDRNTRRWIANTADDLWKESGSVMTEHAIITALEKAIDSFDEWKGSVTGKKPKAASQSGETDDDDDDDEAEEWNWEKPLPKALTGSSPAGTSNPPNPANSAEASRLARRLFSSKGG